MVPREAGMTGDEAAAAGLANAAGLDTPAGHITPRLDSDGAVRRVPALVCFGQRNYPALALAAPRLAEHMNMRTFKWMKQMADQTGALILGSSIVTVHERYYNRLLWMEPGGNFKTYDKRHLFRMSNEHKTYAPGESLLISTWKGWRICPLICYDLRFPVWSRNRVSDGYVESVRITNVGSYLAAEAVTADDQLVAGHQRPHAGWRAGEDEVTGQQFPYAAQRRNERGASEAGWGRGRDCD